jgi:uncharacterized protein YutE (UPF0331/DUF86 family)
MVDAARLGALLDRLATGVDGLEALRAWTDERLFADDLAMPAVKYRFIVVMETAIDAGEHVIAAEALRVPTDYADVCAVLADSGWLDGGLAGRLTGAARFLYLLVHGYATVDDRRVIEALREDLDDLRRYRQRSPRSWRPAAMKVADEVEEAGLHLHQARPGAIPACHTDEPIRLHLALSDGERHLDEALDVADRPAHPSG